MKDQSTQQEGRLRWIPVSEKLPDYIDDKDYSENVFTICGGRLCVMARCYDPGAEGWLWGNCYGDINGDPETDDDYNVTHWMPLPPTPGDYAFELMQRSSPLTVDELQQKFAQHLGVPDLDTTDAYAIECAFKNI